MSKSESPRYTVVVTCVVLCEKEEKLLTLILKRSEKEQEGPGLWTVPGGKVEKVDWGEPHATKSHSSVYFNALSRATIREVLQETGVALKEIVLLKDTDLVFIRKDGTPTLVFRFCGICPDLVSVRKNNESTDSLWITEDELAKYPFIGNVEEDIRKTMREYATNLLLRDSLKK